MKFGVVPSFYVERGFHPVAGAYLFADDFVVDGNDLRLSTSLGFGHQSLTVTNRFTRGGWRFISRHHASRRDDYQFFGTGPSSRDEDRQRFGALKLETSGALEARTGRARATFELGYRGVDFRSSDYGGDPSADTTSSRFAGGSYHGAFQRLGLLLDTRRAAEGGGWASLELELGRHHLRGEATAGFAAGLGRGRVVTVGAGAAMVEGIDGEVPITELVSVGGSGPMPGFAAGRLSGDSAVSLAARYEWPVAPWLNGSLQAGAGNVFDERWGGFAPDLLRFSGAMGLRTSGSPDNAFEVLVALGTATIDDGAGIESVRLVLGGSTGF